MRYPELERALAECGEPSLLQLRETVIRLRRKKSMVVDSQDENRRSAGSFFVNPIVNEELARQAEERAAVLAPGEPMPRYPTESGAVKLSAAWLIERAGMVRGTSRGPVGISSRHSLAIINRGGASAREIVRERVGRGVSGDGRGGVRGIERGDGAEATRRGRRGTG